jgi:hypothetical protein
MHSNYVCHSSYGVYRLLDAIFRNPGLVVVRQVRIIQIIFRNTNIIYVLCHTCQAYHGTTFGNCRHIVALRKYEICLMIHVYCTDKCQTSAKWEWTGKCENKLTKCENSIFWEKPYCEWKKIGSLNAKLIHIECTENGSLRNTLYIWCNFVIYNGSFTFIKYLSHLEFLLLAVQHKWKTYYETLFGTTLVVISETYNNDEKLNNMHVVSALCGVGMWDKHKKCSPHTGGNHKPLGSWHLLPLCKII